MMEQKRLKEYKYLGLWQTLFLNCDHDWKFSETIQEPAYFYINNVADIYTCPKCGYSKKVYHY